MKRTLSTRHHRRRAGFTLIECIVSIAIFAIMGTMFASFMMSSVRVVNLTLANDRDREALLEAISAANAEKCDTANGTVSVAAVGTDGKILNLNIQLGTGNKVTLDDKYVRYTAPNGTRYSIYLGANAMAVKYLVLMNMADNDVLKEAINSKKKTGELQVVYKGETKQFTFVVDAADPLSQLAIINDKEGKPYYVKYTSPKGEKYLIYFCTIDKVTP